MVKLCGSRKSRKSRKSCNCWDCVGERCVKLTASERTKQTALANAQKRKQYANASAIQVKKLKPNASPPETVGAPPSLSTEDYVVGMLDIPGLLDLLDTTVAKDTVATTDQNTS
jgi:hypothetical protein